MKTKISLSNTIVTLILVGISYTSQAHVFQGLKAFKTLIEYEGQRFLMQDVFEITSENIDKLAVEKTIKEVDNDEGFMFVLTSYVYNGKSGVVFTSFNATNFERTHHNFTNVHLTKDEYDKLYQEFNSLNQSDLPWNMHNLRKFNDRITMDVTHEATGGNGFILWVDTENRHTFTEQKWDRAYKRFQKFIEEYKL